MDDAEKFLPFFEEMQELLCLYVKANPALRMITNFRRNMVMNMPKLYYLDDRPITEIERAGIEAFKTGGKEAEIAARDAIIKARHQSNLNATRKLSKQMDESKQERKAIFKKMCAEVNDEKKELVEKRDDLKAQMKNLPVESHERSRLNLKLIKVEEELRQDWFLKLKKDGGEVPHSMGRPRNMTSKQFLEDNEKR